jgi:hypothetical protein
MATTGPGITPKPDAHKEIEANYFLFLLLKTKK